MLSRLHEHNKPFSPLFSGWQRRNDKAEGRRLAIEKLFARCGTSIDWASLKIGLGTGVDWGVRII